MVARVPKAFIYMPRHVFRMRKGIRHCDFTALAYNRRHPLKGSQARRFSASSYNTKNRYSGCIPIIASLISLLRAFLDISRKKFKNIPLLSNWFHNVLEISKNLENPCLDKSGYIAAILDSLS